MGRRVRLVGPRSAPARIWPTLLCLATGLFHTSLLAALGCGARSTGVVDGGPADAGCVPTWEIDRIDRVGFGGWASSLVIDGDGDPVVSYAAGRRDEGPSGVLVSHDDGGVWTATPIDPELQGFFPSIALDTNGASHVAYWAGGFDPGEGSVQVASDASGAWTVDAIESGLTGGLGTSIAIDPAGDVHVLYATHGSPGGELRHAIRSAAGVTVETVASWTETDWGSSIAVTPDGVVVATWIERGNLTLGRRTDGIWDVEIVSSLPREYGQGFVCPSLDVGADGMTRIAFQSQTGRIDMAYASDEGGAWTLETVDGSVDGVQKGFGASLAVDPDGTAWTSYTTSIANPETGDELWAASRRDGVWHPEPVDRSGRIGFPYGCEVTSIATAPDGTVHVSYWDAGSRDLLHAVRRECE